MKIFNEISKLLDYARCNLLLQSGDVNYVINNLLDILHLDSFEQTQTRWDGCGVEKLLLDFTSAAVEDGVFAEENAAYYCDKVMGALSCVPSVLDGKFRDILERSGAEAATDFLYGYSVANNYVKKEILDRNPRFNRDGLVVTINLAKPEFRDPNKAKTGNSVQGGYPKCVICRQNEGLSKCGKSTLRTVSLKLGGKDWFWQYSPYGYFNQHGIAVNTEHVPMHIDRQTFVNLMDFVDLFPHYFIGCNAPLERIGGSVLAHDHYQGGGEILPLHTAGLNRIFTDKDYPDVTVGIVDWAGTVVRVSGYNRNSVAEVSDKIRRAWKTYSNKALGIVCKDGDKQFNEISPSVIMRSGSYEMNIILRSNITSAEYPDGVFHAHPEFHSVKKESIGIVEAHGLFILPGRLVAELDELKRLIVQGRPLTENLLQFKLVYDEICAIIKTENLDVNSAVEKELASICSRILHNTAVFKQERDFASFLQCCGLDEVKYTHKISAAGRINIIGEHIDYCGGKVLPAAISLANTVFVRANGTDKINIQWTTLPDKVTVDVNNLDGAKVNKYAGVQLGCMSVYNRSGRKLVGCDLLYDCKVPFGGGLSSSAAIEISTLCALAQVGGCSIDKRELALMAQQAEMEYSGVNCGIMDQYASANGVKNAAILLDCSTVTHSLVPLNLGGYVFIVANTNKPHSLVESKYNERRAEVERGLEILKRYIDIDCLAQITLSQFDKYGNKPEGVLHKRVKHVVCECDRVNKAVDAMEQGDLIQLGKLLNQSHTSLRDDYEVSCKELDVLQKLSAEFDGCLGARMIGGGFGGCVLALVKKNAAERFKKEVGAKYQQAVGYKASFDEANISNGITVESLKEAQ